MKRHEYTERRRTLDGLNMAINAAAILLAICIPLAAWKLSEILSWICAAP